MIVIQKGICKYLRIKSQVLKIRACITARVAVLQPEWRSHECCNTATSAVIHASIFNTWLLILKYLYYLFFLCFPKKQGIFQCWILLVNTQCSSIFQYGIFHVLDFFKKKIFFTHFTTALKEFWKLKYYFFTIIWKLNWIISF